MHAFSSQIPETKVCMLVVEGMVAFMKYEKSKTRKKTSTDISLIKDDVRCVELLDPMQLRCFTVHGAASNCSSKKFNRGKKSLFMTFQIMPH